MKPNKLILTAFLITYTTAVSAHPGHDHSHWMSIVLHFMFYASLASAVGIATYAAYKNVSIKSHK